MLHKRKRKKEKRKRYIFTKETSFYRSNLIFLHLYGRVCMNRCVCLDSHSISEKRNETRSCRVSDRMKTMLSSSKAICPNIPFKEARTTSFQLLARALAPSINTSNGRRKNGLGKKERKKRKKIATIDLTSALVAEFVGI
jgi:hypothetical protein